MRFARRSRSTEACTRRRRGDEGTDAGRPAPRGAGPRVGILADVEHSDRSTTVRRLLSNAVRQWKLEHYVRRYGDGKLTLARAARDAGVSLWEMMDYARARKVPAQYDLEDLKRDLGTIRRA